MLWSFGVLLREIAVLYDAFSQDLPSPLSELPVQFGDYARWLEARLAGDALDAQVAVWKRRLAGTLPVLELPADRPRPPVQSCRGVHAVHALLPSAVAGGLRESVRRPWRQPVHGPGRRLPALLGRLTRRTT